MHSSRVDTEEPSAALLTGEPEARSVLVATCGPERPRAGRPWIGAVGSTPAAGTRGAVGSPAWAELQQWAACPEPVPAHPPPPPCQSLPGPRWPPASGRCRQQSGGPLTRDTQFPQHRATVSGGSMSDTKHNSTSREEVSSRPPACLPARPSPPHSDLSLGVAAGEKGHILPAVPHKETISHQPCYWGPGGRGPPQA